MCFQTQQQQWQQRWLQQRHKNVPSLDPLAPQILQTERPPSLPPIYEMSRPELKLAGMRIDPDLFAGSKMSYSLSLAVVSSDQV